MGKLGMRILLVTVALAAALGLRSLIQRRVASEVAEVMEEPAGTETPGAAADGLLVETPAAAPAAGTPPATPSEPGPVAVRTNP